MNNEQFWLAKDLYDDDLIFFNTTNIVTMKPIMDDDVITGYRVYTVDEECYEVKFKTGPFSRMITIKNGHQPIFA